MNEQSVDVYLQKPTDGLRKDFTIKPINILEIFLIFTSLVSFLLIAKFFFNDTVVDDSYISFRYARNLTNGFGLSWNPGEPPVEGFTNLLWVIELAVINAITGASFPVIAVWSGIAWGLGTIILIWLAVRRLTNSRMAVIAAFCFAFCAAFARHAVSGLETTQVACVAALFCLLFTARYQNSLLRSLTYGTLTILAIVTRPDAIVIAFLMVIAFLCLIPNDRRNRQKSITTYVIITILILILYMIFNKIYFGSPLPLPFYIKSRPYEILKSRILFKSTLFYYLEYYKYVGIWVVIAIVSLVNRHGYSRIIAIYMVPTFLFSLYMLSVVPIMGFDLRFFIPTFSLVVLASSVSLISLLENRDRQKTPLSIAINAGLVLFFCFQDLGSFGKMGYEANNLANSWNDQLAFAKKLSAIPDLTVAGSEAGIMSYVSNAAFFDYAGLNDRFIATHRFKTPDFPAIYEVYLKGMMRKPDIYMRPSREYSYADLEKIPELRDQYDGPFLFDGTLQFYILRSSGHYLELSKLGSRAF